ncbi:lipopolysaccharide biosynthesis protein [Terrimonas ferruginea]|uniref:lipopolysaccharide biosynthesis protein n=1 Tax=Terrimonas ferruginea TaxID=249 RepID=UPI0003FB28A8|nr:oligosaccharide flippase family protein [Terrimonas ferruginea]
MSSIKQLAGQTMWYGVSSIAARFLNYLLTPYLTSALLTSAYGEMQLIYSLIPFLNILFTYGLETAYFRYIQKKEQAADVYDTITVSLIISTVSLTTLMILFRGAIADIISLQDHTEYITWCAFIIGLDALTTIAFAKLRHDNRPVKYAVIRISGILVYIALTIFFLSVCPRIAKDHPDHFLLLFYKPGMEVGYLILANVAQSLFTFILLRKEFFAFRWRFNKTLWREIMRYSMPLLIVGFGGMVNETMDRIMLRWWSTSADPLTEIGIYSGCYKLSILITLFVQAFRMGAEPFFFKQSQGENPQRTYARVMKFFVIAVCLMFLVVVLYLDIWKHFLSRETYWTGLRVVPILLLANMFLGIYYNLSIWYKVTNRTRAGATITFIGAGITLLINFLFIPSFGYMACAWATFLCYGTMMVLSFVWGQKVYRIPYAWKKLVAYIVIVVLLYGIAILFGKIGLGTAANFAFSTLLLALFGWFILNVEKKEFSRMPVIGKFIR